MLDTSLKRFLRLVGELKEFHEPRRLVRLDWPAVGSRGESLEDFPCRRGAVRWRLRADKEDSPVGGGRLGPDWFERPFDLHHFDVEVAIPFLWVGCVLVLEIVRERESHVVPAGAHFGPGFVEPRLALDRVHVVTLD